VTGADRLRIGGARRLAAAGIDNAAGEAALLLAHVLHTEPGRLLLVDEVAAAEETAFEELISRRTARIPLQHLTGRVFFAGVELTVGPGVFVPRPETELLVEWATTTAAARPGSGTQLRVADLCSGSGALALAIATALPGAQVTAVERSAAALEYLRANTAAQPDSVADRVQVVAGDVTDPAVWAGLGEFDLIVANPPYVPAAATVSPEVAHDPAEAVFSGASGMDLIEAMAGPIGAALVPGGSLAVEHDDSTAAATVAVFARDERFAQVRGHTDLAGRARYVTARRTGESVVQGWKA